MDIRLLLMTGGDIPIPSLTAAIHQPTIREIAMIGEKDFFIGAQLLCVDKNFYIQDKNTLSQTNNFQIFMTVLSDKNEVSKKIATLQVLTLLFPKYKVNLTPRTLLLIDGENSIVIDENNFEDLQAILRSVFCLDKSSQDTFNPANEAARKIAEKLMRGRQRVAAQKGELDASVLTQYLSILTIGLNSMSLQDLMNLTMFQLYDLIERYMLWTSWDLDIRQRLAGGSPDSTPDNWMKNIH